MRLVTSVIDVVWHRNGVGGEGFWAVRFVGPDDRGDETEFLGIVFEEPRYCTVLSIERLKVEAFNSWRGDRYEPELREAIAQYEAKMMQNLKNRTNGDAP